MASAARRRLGRREAEPQVSRQLDTTRHRRPFVQAVGATLSDILRRPALGVAGGGSRKNLLVAEATAKEIGRLSLGEALELTLLIAREDPVRHPRVAARWLRLYLDESLDVTIDEAAMVAASLSALTGRGGEAAVETLRAMAERATRRGRARGVA